MIWPGVCIRASEPPICLGFRQDDSLWYWVRCPEGWTLMVQPIGNLGHFEHCAAPTVAEWGEKLDGCVKSSRTVFKEIDKHFVCGIWDSEEDDYSRQQQEDCSQSL